MTDGDWHAGGVVASVITAGGMAAMLAIGFVGMYGWIGIPIGIITLGAIVLCWLYIRSKTRQVRPETNAETSARTGKQFYAVLATAMIILMMALIAPGMMFHD